MSAISVYLERLRSALFGEDVRGAIIGAITECYDNVNDPTLRTDALERALQHKIDQGKMAALTIADGTITKAKLDPNISFESLAVAVEDECLVFSITDGSTT